MRSTFFFAALLLVVTLGALLVVRESSGPSSGSSRSTFRGTVTLVGDSLNVGVERYLPAVLPGWRIFANDRVGRTTREGILELQAGRPTLSSFVVVSLGTNDAKDVVSFRSDVARVLALAGSNRCVIWATIWRDGTPNDGFNAVLREAAAANRRVRLVEWAEMVQAHSDWLAADGLHGSEVGYRARAHAIASAAKSCTPTQTATAA